MMNDVRMITVAQQRYLKKRANSLWISYSDLPEETRLEIIGLGERKKLTVNEASKMIDALARMSLPARNEWETDEREQAKKELLALLDRKRQST